MFLLCLNNVSIDGVCNILLRNSLITFVAAGSVGGDVVLPIEEAGAATLQPRPESTWNYKQCK